MPILSVNFGNRISDTITNIRVPSVILVLLHHSTVTNVDQFAAAVLYLSYWYHTEVTGSPARSADSCSGWFVWNKLPGVGVEA